MATGDTSPTAFAGFPDAALDFYDDLELDNTKSFWEAHKHVYESAVRVPMLALTAALADEFGTAKVFRPYRDVRFASDKTPYKNHQGAIVAGRRGDRLLRPDRLAGRLGQRRLLPRRRSRPVPHPHRHRRRALRQGAREDRGPPPQEGVRDPRRPAEDLPRGYSTDHPRIDLLRYKSMSMTKSYGFENLDTPDLLDRVREDWRALRPLVEWVRARVDPLG